MMALEALTYYMLFRLVQFLFINTDLHEISEENRFC